MNQPSIKIINILLEFDEGTDQDAALVDCIVRCRATPGVAAAKMLVEEDQETAVSAYIDGVPDVVNYAGANSTQITTHAGLPDQATLKRKRTSRPSHASRPAAATRHDTTGLGRDDSGGVRPSQEGISGQYSETGDHSDTGRPVRAKQPPARYRPAL